ncbi:hypothetical protein V1508DRAFT_423620, partial [Lipomyces doorenjongii]|uniref:uncharacterized protein n=1 Tax=Lipomyces doorenjongii TaxID=383834 RepID=UPI0034CD2623
GYVATRKFFNVFVKLFILYVRILRIITNKFFSFAFAFVSMKHPNIRIRIANIRTNANIFVIRVHPYIYWAFRPFPG